MSTKTMGAILFALTVFGFVWKASEEWTLVKARVAALERKEQYLHGTIKVPSSGDAEGSHE